MSTIDEVIIQEIESRQLRTIGVKSPHRLQDGTHSCTTIAMQRKLYFTGHSNMACRVYTIDDGNDIRLIEGIRPVMQYMNRWRHA